MNTTRLSASEAIRTSAPSAIGSSSLNFLTFIATTRARSDSSASTRIAWPRATYEASVARMSLSPSARASSCVTPSTLTRCAATSLSRVSVRATTSAWWRATLSTPAISTVFTERDFAFLDGLEHLEAVFLEGLDHAVERGVHVETERDAVGRAEDGLQLGVPL